MYCCLRFSGLDTYNRVRRRKESREFYQKGKQSVSLRWNHGRGWLAGRWQPAGLPTTRQGNFSCPHKMTSSRIPAQCSQANGTGVPGFVLRLKAEPLLLSQLTLPLTAPWAQSNKNFRVGFMSEETTKREERDWFTFCEIEILLLSPNITFILLQ